MQKMVIMVGLLSMVFCGAVQAENSMQNNGNYEKATFAGGCFWGMEKIFGELPGVLSTCVGYAGGHVHNPIYEAVSMGHTGHAEAVEVVYDPAKISYDELLEFFFTHHDPTTLNRQGNDVGDQYRSVIFYHSPAQEMAARNTRELLEKSGVFRNPIVTEIEAAGEFYEAEKYHQKYLEKNPKGYCHINFQSKKVSEVLKAAR